MKALSIRQPWAQLVLMGWRDVVNQPCPTNHRGALLIHAARHVDREEELFYRNLCCKEGVPWPAELATDAIVGVVEPADCVTASDSEWFDGPYGLVLDKPVSILKPIPYSGSPGLFDVPDKLIMPFAPELARLWAHWGEQDKGGDC